MIKVIKADETFELRKKVLRKGIDLPFRFDGDDSPETIHVGYFDVNKRLKGVLTLIPRSLETPEIIASIQLRGMAVDHDVQGTGLGSKLLKWSFNYLKESGYDSIWCNARVKAYAFYQRNGFMHLNREFEIEQIGLHDIMYKKL